MPRSRSQASNPPGTAPLLRRQARMRCTNGSFAAATSAPARTSPWPFRNLVAECTTRSAPRRERPGVHRRGHGAVDDQPGVSLVRNLRGCGDVGDGPRGIGRGLDPHDAGPVRIDGLLPRGEVAGVDVGDGDAPGEGKLADPLPQRPVHDRGGDDVVAGSQRTEHRRGGGHTGGEQQCAVPLLELGQEPLGGVVGGVVRPRVLVGAGVGAVGGPLEGGRRMDGRDQCPRVGVDRAERLSPARDSGFTSGSSAASPAASARPGSGCASGCWPIRRAGPPCDGTPWDRRGRRRSSRAARTAPPDRA